MDHPLQRLCALAGTCAFALAVLATPASAGQAGVRYDIAQTRAATAKYQDVRRAVSDGYVADPHCVSSPAGTMGYHYIKQSAIGRKLDVRKPQALLYVTRRDGGMRLVGVEYLVWDADGRLDTDGDRPYLFGRGFDGPMAGHGPGMPVHYDLHAWVWKHNPRGTFAAWNPALSC